MQKVFRRAFPAAQMDSFWQGIYAIMGLMIFKIQLLDKAFYLAMQERREDYGEENRALARAFRLQRTQ